MKTIIRIALLLGLIGTPTFAQWGAVLSGVTSVSKQTASDVFNYTDGTNLNTHGSWVAILNTINVKNTGSKYGFLGATGGANEFYFWNSGSWAANQYAQIYNQNIAGTTVNNGGVMVRADATNGYYCIYVGGTIYVGRINSGTVTSVTSFAQSISVGNGLRLTVTGTGSATRLQCSVDTGTGFSNVGSSIDPGGTYINSGGPGISSYSNGGANAVWGNWSASDL